MQVSLDSEVGRKAGRSSDVFINRYIMRVPNANGSWPDDFGGK